MPCNHCLSWLSSLSMCTVYIAGILRINKSTVIWHITVRNNLRIPKHKNSKYKLKIQTIFKQRETSKWYTLIYSRKEKVLIVWNNDTVLMAFSQLKYGASLIKQDKMKILKPIIINTTPSPQHEV